MGSTCCVTRREMPIWERWSAPGGDIAPSLSKRESNLNASKDHKKGTAETSKIDEDHDDDIFSSESHRK